MIPVFMTSVNKSNRTSDILWRKCEDSQKTAFTRLHDFEEFPKWQSLDDTEVYTNHKVRTSTEHANFLTEN